MAATQGALLSTRRATHAQTQCSLPCASYVLRPQRCTLPRPRVRYPPCVTRQLGGSLLLGSLAHSRAYHERQWDFCRRQATAFVLHWHRRAVILSMEEWALPKINLALCNRCGMCVEGCPTKAVEMKAEGPSIVRPDDCAFCALCETICSEGAITCTFEIVWQEHNG